MEIPEENMEPMQIFISHDSRDVEIADDLASVLRDISNQKLVGFVAGGRSSSVSIRSGQDWRKAIAEALELCEAVVCIATGESLVRPWVNYELGFADANDKKIFVLVLDNNATGRSSHPVADRQFVSANPDSVVNFLTEIIDFVNEKRGLEGTEKIQIKSNVKKNQSGYCIRYMVEQLAN